MYYSTSHGCWVLQLLLPKATATSMKHTHRGGQHPHPVLGPDPSDPPTRDKGGRHSRPRVIMGASARATIGKPGNGHRTGCGAIVLLIRLRHPAGLDNADGKVSFSRGGENILHLSLIMSFRLVCC